MDDIWGLRRDRFQCTRQDHRSQNQTLGRQNQTDHGNDDLQGAHAYAHARCVCHSNDASLQSDSVGFQPHREIATFQPFASEVQYKVLFPAQSFTFFLLVAHLATETEFFIPLVITHV
mgnify:CR=1 FL=1